MEKRAIDPEGLRLPLKKKSRSKHLGIIGLEFLDARLADVIQPPQERADVGSARAGGNSGAGLRIFRQTGKIQNNPKQTEAANVVFVGIDKKGLRFLNRLL